MADEQAIEIRDELAEQLKTLLSPQDRLAVTQGAFGEGAGASDEVVKMIIRSIINRYRAGRSAEFGSNIPEILNKGYYAVSKQNLPYKQAISGKFPDVRSKQRFGEIQQMVEEILSNKDYGETMFYFTPEKEEKLKQKGAFDFKKVKPTGTVGKYKTYGY